MGKSLEGTTLLCEDYNMRTSKELPFFIWNLHDAGLEVGEISG